MHESKNSFVHRAPGESASSNTSSPFLQDLATPTANTPSPHPALPERLAVVMLLDPSGNGDGGANWLEALDSFISNYQGSAYDVFILHEAQPDAGMPYLTLENVPALATLLESRRSVALFGDVSFIDVRKHFSPDVLGPLGDRQIGGGGCSYSLGYRLMCRFMSGPLYWLPELERYDQLLRIDDDSRYTHPIRRPLQLRDNEMYAYAIVSHDHEDCQRGVPEMIRAAYEGKPDVLRFGSLIYAEPWVHNKANLMCVRRFRSHHALVACVRVSWECGQRYLPAG